MQATHRRSWWGGQRAAPIGAARTRPRRWRTRLGRTALGVLALALLWLGYRFTVPQPSNQRDWEYGMETLPHITVDGDLVSAEHVRDFSWPADGTPSSNYLDRTFDVAHLQRV